MSAKHKEINNFYNDVFTINGATKDEKGELVRTPVLIDIHTLNGSIRLPLLNVSATTNLAGMFFGAAKMVEENSKKMEENTNAFLHKIMENETGTSTKDNGDTTENNGDITESQTGDSGHETDKDSIETKKLSTGEMVSYRKKKYKVKEFTNAAKEKDYIIEKTEDGSFISPENSTFKGIIKKYLA